MTLVIYALSSQGSDKESRVILWCEYFFDSSPLLISADFKLAFDFSFQSRQPAFFWSILR